MTAQVACPMCHKLVRLCVDGTLYRHENFERMRCKASGTKYELSELFPDRNGYRDAYWQAQWFIGALHEL